MRRRITACLVAAVSVSALLAAPTARADDFSGWSPSLDLGSFSPLDFQGVFDMSAPLGSALSLMGAPSDDGLGAYEIVALAAASSDSALSSAEIARTAQEAADAKRAQATLGAQAGPEGCPTASPGGTLRSGAESIGAYQLCADSVAQAPTEAAAKAIKWAFSKLGAPYACGGEGRMEAFRFDCSSLVSRAYYEGAGIGTAGDSWAPSTRDMVPWDGAALGRWYSYVAPADARPGDLILYDTGGSTYRHVVMLLADGFMLHTNSCGDVAHVTAFWGFDSRFLVARRVVAS